MAFSVKAWLDRFGSGGDYDQPTDTGDTPDTPWDAAGARDMETRLSGYTDSREAAEVINRNAAINVHSADTTAVHGIADTSALATSAGVTSAVAAHEADTSVHGIADTTALATDAEVAAAVAAHTGDTTDAHLASAIGVSPSVGGDATVQAVLATHETRLDSAQSGHTIEDEGTPVTDRDSLNFTGAGVAVTDSGGKTVVTISGAGVSDATTSTAGVTRLSKAPASPTVPIALGVNDERVSPTAPASQNLTGTMTVVFVGAEERWLSGPLTGNLAANGQASAVAGSRLRIHAVQGATPRTITVDGNAVTPISQVNGALIKVDVDYVDVAGTITPRIVATTTEADPLAIAKTLVDAKGDLIVATAADTVARQAVGTDGYALVADSSQTNGVKYSHRPVVVTASKTGALTAAAGTVRLPIMEAGTIEDVRIMVGTAPTGASLIVDVNKNGTTIFTTQGNRPTVAISGNASSAAVPDVTSLAAGDYLTVDIDQIGSTIAGSDLCVAVRYRLAA